MKIGFYASKLHKGRRSLMFFGCESRHKAGRGTKWQVLKLILAENKILGIDGVTDMGANCQDMKAKNNNK